jgi:copper chaperone CopZ
MKNLILILFTLVFSSVNAQEKTNNETKTTTFNVAGECGQCKKRVENAAKIKGVKSADWNLKTHVMTVTYSPDKVSDQDIKASILKSGHDVNNEKADVAAYKRLPECCKYRKE